jgi:hypothetical protein
MYKHRKHPTYDPQSVDGGMDSYPEEVSEQADMDDDTIRESNEEEE